MSKFTIAEWERGVRETFTESYHESNPHHRELLKRVREMSSPGYYEVGNLRIGKPRKLGAQWSYHVEWFSYLRPEHCPGVQGQNDMTLLIDVDMEDVAMRSAGL